MPELPEMEIVARRLSQGAIGFHAGRAARLDKRDPAIFRHVEPDDLLQFGLIPEFVGRLPVVASLDGLTDAEMRQILVEPRNAIVRQYQKLFAMDGVDLVFDDDAMGAIVQKAHALGTGARGLRAVMEQTMLEIMFNIHAHANIGSCRITRATVLEGAGPIYEERKASA